MNVYLVLAIALGAITGAATPATRLVPPALVARRRCEAVRRAIRERLPSRRFRSTVSRVLRTITPRRLPLLMAIASAPRAPAAV